MRHLMCNSIVLSSSYQKLCLVVLTLQILLEKMCKALKHLQTGNVIMVANKPGCETSNRQFQKLFDTTQAILQACGLFLNPSCGK